ncbi:hypothetical protein [Dokdonella sp.]|uniref:hypothetical protein n=1 Tax=Dokdonella sp. TaxID=2291710 RepID=UPI002F418D76
MSDAGALQQRKTQVIAAALGTHVVLGGIMLVLFPGMMHPDTLQQTMETMQAQGINLLFELVALGFCFAWLALDARQLEIRRPWWLNVGIVLFKSVFIPYYLYKTRPQGQRGTAILAWFGLYFAALLAMTAGAMIALMLGGAPLPRAPGI